ncbi:ABC transporter ATP-binding protein [Rhodohalobacter sp. SW132]|uniref:ABC transporter ATP-binding protein n=1 Tax=Rhodohalobacter sp. SW132 TaxID=2293433 RepID=UPI000E2556E8|nr:ABC transporter ATP-binding protein [Rhodohalobacter sp. SW132]REL33259.1 ABC transporter ATP-binding protein [Rhodohalobacter sp. SW132]
MTALTVKNLTKQYPGKPVFRDLSVQAENRKVGVAGSNGAGKSTFLRCISGLIPSNSGTIEWTVDQNKYSATEIQPFLGFSAPYVELYEELTAAENLQFIRDLRSDQDCAEIPELIKRFEISEFFDSLYGSLSSGQRQRVKLAASVLHRPKILCLDEPGTNLDEDGHHLVRNMTDQAVVDGGIVLLASNQPHELELCDIVIRLGG